METQNLNSPDALWRPMTQHKTLLSNRPKHIVKGVKANSMKEMTEKLRTALKDQMENGESTFIEVVLNQELGEPFRRDAMKAPVPVAGINKDDMQLQQC